VEQHRAGEGCADAEKVRVWPIDFGKSERGATVMGGDNSGRRTDKLTVEDCVTVSTGDLLRYGFLPECDCGLMTWRNGFGEQVYSLTLDVRAGVVSLWQTRQTVALESLSLHFGGLRWWFRCPKCDRRCAKLYLLEGRFICRLCCNLAYQSSRLHRSFGSLAVILSRKRRCWVSQPEVERVCMQIRRDQRPRWIRKRDRRPDYKPLDWRRQEIKRQLGTLWLGDDLA
jgi:hypothetical protein